MMEHSANALENATIKGFSNPIVLGGVMCGEAAFGSLGLKVSREILIQVFPPTIRA